MKTDRWALAERLVRARREKGLTIHGAAKATGNAVLESEIDALENGRLPEPSPRILWYLAHAYGVEYMDLMRAVGYVKAAQETP